MVDDKQAPPTGAEQRLHNHNMQLPVVPTPLGAHVENAPRGDTQWRSAPRHIDHARFGTEMNTPRHVRSLRCEADWSKIQ
jgi:hypothetical protein